jgi:phospholipid/cholesterol/gamma-HCH transport system substrate-binding protein
VKKKEEINYVAIGIFIFLGVVLFLVGLYFAGQFMYMAGGGYKLNVEFTFLDNLTPKSKVRVLGGKDIGYVDEILFHGNKLVTVLVIEGQYKINRSATFHIYSTGVVGTKYISVENFNPEEEDFFENGEVIQGVSPLGMSQMLDMFSDLGSSLLGDIDAETLANLRRVFKNTADLVENLNRVVVANEKDIRQSIANLERATENIERVSEALTAIEKMQVENIVKNLEATTSDLKKITSDLEKSDGILQLAQDKEFKRKLENTLANLEEFTEVLKNKPNAILLGR